MCILKLYIYIFQHLLFKKYNVAFTIDKGHAYRNVKSLLDSKLIQNKKIKALFPSDARRMEGYQVCHHRK